MLGASAEEEEEEDGEEGGNLKKAKASSCYSPRRSFVLSIQWRPGFHPPVCLIQAARAQGPFPQHPWGEANPSGGVKQEQGSSECVFFSERERDGPSSNL